MFKNITATLVENRLIAKGIFRLVLHCPGVELTHFVPGQFAHVRVPRHPELLLGRPLSISAADAAAQTVTLICQLRGAGTRALAQSEKGAQLSAILPVGRGFRLQSADKTVWLVGGGVGIAPLLAVPAKWPDRRYESFLGYRGRDFAYCTDDFAACGAVHIASDDGTIGTQGQVTDLLGARLAQKLPDVILACGPGPMLRALKALVSPHRLACQVSVEERMCCGFGACAACACGVETGRGLDYKKACIEGPVFDLYEVVL